jgi:hypothetical protein
MFVYATFFLRVGPVTPDGSRSSRLIIPVGSGNAMMKGSGTLLPGEFEFTLRLGVQTTRGNGFASGNSLGHNNPQLEQLTVDAGNHIVRQPRLSSRQTWTTFLRNHVGEMVSVDFLVVASVRLKL